VQKTLSKEVIERVYAALKNCEPQTPNEIAQDVKLNQKTVQIALMELANTENDVRWKKVGRYRLFWKEHTKGK
jgi:predicted ArsR family transcriptional regulator